jgi:acyl-CoA thioester hydrolase
MGVPHHQEPERRIGAEPLGCPLRLGRRFAVKARSVHAMFAETLREPAHQRDTNVGVERPVHGRGRAQPHQSVERAAPAAGGRGIAMEREHPASAHGELQLDGRESDAELRMPESAAAPAVVVSAHHRYRESPGEPPQCCSHLEAVPGNNPAVGEPELEEISIDEQRVAQRRHGVEKVEQDCLGLPRRVSQVGVGDDDQSLWHGPKHAGHPVTGQADAVRVSETMLRVNYSETDQMGVVYHARYLVWLDVARCEHLRVTGLTYRELEERGLRLAVSDMALRYRRPARYDELIRVRCWVRELASRRVTFGYAVERAEGGELLATATVSLLSLDASMSPTRLPADVLQRLVPVPDPVRL